MTSLCKHLTAAEEAWVLDPSTGKTRSVRAERDLCGWIDSEPERLVDAPRWLQREALAGRMFSPAKDCPGCPGYEPE